MALNLKKMFKYDSRICDTGVRDAYAKMNISNLSTFGCCDDLSEKYVLKKENRKEESIDNYA